MRPQLLSDMLLVVKLSNCQSFSRAAKELGIATSSFSRRIAAFEESLGMRLIDRTTRRFAFTAQGVEYAKEAGRILEEAERVFGEFQVQTRTLSGEIRVAVPQLAVVVRLVSSLIARFSEEHQDISFQVLSGAPSSQIPARDWELAILAGTPQEASMIVRKVGEVETGLFASTAYLQRHPRPTRPLDLRGRHLLTVEGFSSAWRFQRDGTTIDLPLSSLGSCNSFSVAEDLMKAGNGIALLPASVDGDPCSQGHEIERVLPDWTPQPIPLYFATPSRLVNARTKLFMNAALDTFRRTSFRATAPRLDLVGAALRHAAASVAA